MKDALVFADQIRNRTNSRAAVELIEARDRECKLECLRALDQKASRAIALGAAESYALDNALGGIAELESAGTGER